MSTTKKITELDAITSAANADLLYIVHDPAGVPTSNKITVQNLLKSANAQIANAYSNSVAVATALAGNAYTNAVAAATSLAGNAYTNAVAYVDTAVSGITVNTGKINFTENSGDPVISVTETERTLHISGNVGPVNIVSDQFSQIAFSQDGSLWGGGNNQAYFWLDSGGTYEYVTHSDPNANISSYTEIDLYANGEHRYYGQFSNTDISLSYGYSISPNFDYGGYAVDIAPSGAFGNKLSIYPTADYDIHLFESGSNGAVTLGGYGWTNLRVYGPGGANGGGGQYGNDIRADLVGNSIFHITTDGGNYSWTFDANGSFVSPYQTSNQRTGSGQVLKLGDNTQQLIVMGAESNSTYMNAQRLVIAGADGTDTGEGGDIYLWAGRSGLNGGSGGDIKIDAGNGLNGSEGGTIKIRGGNSDSGTGGFVEIWSGSGGTAYGNISVHNNGYQWNFNANGEFTLPTNGDIKDVDGSSPLRDIPQNLYSTEADYTLQYTDRGKHVLIESNIAAIVPDNGTVAFPKGTTVAIVSSSQNVAVLPSGNSVIYNNGTQVFSNSSVDQGFYITPYTMATLLKVADDTWILSAPNLQTGW